MKIFFVSLLLLLITQTASTKTDSIRIRKYEHNFILMGFVAQDFANVNMIVPEHEWIYRPNNPAKLGIGLSWKNTILSFAYGYAFDFLRNKKYGKTSSIDLQYHYYGQSVVFDLFMQKYKGFYKLEDDTNFDGILCPDMKIKQYGVHGQYVFNHKKFSYRAAFIHNEKQIRSAGSFLLGGGIYYCNIKSDTSFIYNGLNRLENFQFGLSLGYAYTWVIDRHWFMNGSITVGGNVGAEKINKLGKQKLEIYPTSFPRISIGYDHYDWSIGLTYLSNLTFPSFTAEQNISIVSGTFQLSFYRRIPDIPPITKLSKSITKLLPIID